MPSRGIDLAPASELEQVRREAAGWRMAEREAEQEVARLQRVVAGGPSPEIAAANARAAAAEEAIAGLELRRRRGDIAREHGVPAELLDGVADDDLQDFAERLSEHMAGERDRVAHARDREQTTHRRNGVLRPVSEQPDGREMDRWIRRAFGRGGGDEQ
jgi:hypothetical protein